MARDGFKKIETLDGITEYRLETNGLSVLSVPLRMAPVVAFMITYRVGSRNESIGETGATHFLEHLMFKGSRRFNRDNGRSIFASLQRVGARVNATTWLDRTNYYELLPDDRLELAIEIEADRMRGALLNEADVESERSVILNELDRGENEPLRKLYQSVWSTAFFAHPYRHPTIGWRSDVERVTADDLRAFYDAFYWPENATLSVIGSFDLDSVFGSISEHFGSIPAGPGNAPEVRTVEPPQKGERRTTVRMSGDLGAVMVAFKSPAADDDQLPAMMMLATVLGQGRTSRLYRRLVDGGLATAVSSAASFLRNPGLFYAYAMLAPGAPPEDVEAGLLESMEALAERPVDDRTLERARATLVAETAFGRDGPFAMASSLNEAIAAGDWRYFVRVPEAIENVTAEQIQDAAAHLFNRDRLTVGVFDPVLSA